jgi:hypothetical protein
MSEELKLTAEERELYERLEPLFEQERQKLAKLLASKPDSQLFGATEYEVRDRVHELGAQALELTANERQKKGRVRRS